MLNMSFIENKQVEEIFNDYDEYLIALEEYFNMDY